MWKMCDYWWPSLLQELTFAVLTICWLENRENLLTVREISYNKPQIRKISNESNHCEQRGKTEFLNSAKISNFKQTLKLKVETEKYDISTISNYDPFNPTHSDNNNTLLAFKENAATKFFLHLLSCFFAFKIAFS